MSKSICCSFIYLLEGMLGSPWVSVTKLTYGSLDQSCGFKVFGALLNPSSVTFFENHPDCS